MNWLQRFLPDWLFPYYTHSEMLTALGKLMSKEKTKT